MQFPPVALIPSLVPVLLGVGAALGLLGIAVLLAGVAIPVLPPPDGYPAHHRLRLCARRARRHVPGRGRRHLTGAVR